ncbi:hypothetical protein SNE40_008687 [Patella caerulea]|uniref:Uncharacterized protein n=1 Tax=Patella caerulea TaxID=87958 RepID=A0AAN8JPM7_PATCE
MDADGILRLALENDDEETSNYVILFGIGSHVSNSTYNPDWSRFNLNNLSDEQIRCQFRFDRNGIHRLATSLHIPDEMFTKFFRSTMVRRGKAMRVCGCHS